MRLLVCWPLRIAAYGTESCGSLHTLPARFEEVTELSTNKQHSLSAPQSEASESGESLRHMDAKMQQTSP